ncbi:MAG: FtsW/RodA/SpoVE family cell cycle protein, partial [Pseudobdellovibrionaceae bacterium]
MYKHLSSPLLLAILTLMGVGLVQVYSSSYIFATEAFGNGLHFFLRQLIFSGLGLVALLAAAQIPIRWIEKWGWTLWALAGLGVAATFIPGLGVKVGGA